MEEKVYKELPPDSGFMDYHRGPCEMAEGTKFLEVQTNQIGMVQLHPCTRMLCVNVFPFSEEYGWVVTDDHMFWERAAEVIEAACKERAPGWNRLHHMGAVSLAKRTS
jgi:hypothetical protein